MLICILLVYVAVANTPINAKKQFKVKVTACGSGQFTCDDGECVPIDERCNQISNCRLVIVKP